MIIHSFDNPFNMEPVLDFCEKLNLCLIVDNIDAISYEHISNSFTNNTATSDHFETYSFCPLHHLTMVEGNAVYTTILCTTRSVIHSVNGVVIASV
jgi:CDP-6-deoxy-D-xylo-4-hexulose-3-dehydrase